MMLQFSVTTMLISLFCLNRPLFTDGPFMPTTNHIRPVVSDERVTMATHLKILGPASESNQTGMCKNAGTWKFADYMKNTERDPLILHSEQCFGAFSDSTGSISFQVYTRTVCGSVV